MDLVLFRGGGDGPSSERRELMDEEGRTAVAVATAHRHDQIARADAEGFLVDLVDGAPWEEVEDRLLAAARDAEQLDMLLRGYKSAEIPRLRGEGGEGR